MSGPRGTGDKSFCCLKLEPSLEPRRSGTALRKAQKRSFATPFDAMQSRSDLSSFVPSQTSITRTRGECEEGQEGLSSSHLHVPAGKGELTSRLACYQLGNYSSLCDYSSNCYCHCYCCCCYCYCYGYRLPATGYRYCCRYGHGYCYCYYLLLLLLPLLLLLLLRLLLRLLLLLLLLHLCLRLRLRLLLLLLLLPLRTHSSYYYYYCNTATTAAITISVCDFCHRLSL